MTAIGLTNGIRQAGSTVSDDTSSGQSWRGILAALVVTIVGGVVASVIAYSLTEGQKPALTNEVDTLRSQLEEARKKAIADAALRAAQAEEEAKKEEQRLQSARDDAAKIAKAQDDAAITKAQQDAAAAKAAAERQIIEAQKAKQLAQAQAAQEIADANAAVARRNAQIEQERYQETLNCNSPNYNVFLDPSHCNKPTAFDLKWGKQ